MNLIVKVFVLGSGWKGVCFLLGNRGGFCEIGVKLGLFLVLLLGLSEDKLGLVFGLIDLHDGRGVPVMPNYVRRGSSLCIPVL